jgi:hypothetical protein
MQTIVIPVSQTCKEDNILGLAEIIKDEFPDDILRISNAIVIETNIPQAVSLFRVIADKNGLAIFGNGNKHAGDAVCLDCGTPVSKPGKRCKKCANKFYISRRKKNLTEFVTESNHVEVEHDIVE